MANRIKYYIPSKSPESWKEFLAEPDKQWKTGYSARSLAYCWEEAQGFPKSVRYIFQNSTYELFHSAELVLGIPEHKAIYHRKVEGLHKMIFMFWRNLVMN